MTVRFWPVEERWLRTEARKRGVPVTEVVEDAVRAYRETIDSQKNGSDIFEAVARGGS